MNNQEELAATFGAQDHSPEEGNYSLWNQSNLHPIQEKVSVKCKSSKLTQSKASDQLSSNLNSKLDFYNQYPVEDRTLMWEQNRKRKIEEIQNREKDSDLSECTFQPVLTSNRNDYLKSANKIEGKVNISSIDKYLSRMYSVRIERENRRIEEENAVGSGKNWKKQTTIPRPPKLSQK